MARRSIRRSQAVTPLGIGALVDFPGQSLMAAGLDVWPNQPECPIQDDRLARRLGVKYFRAPPPHPRRDSRVRTSPLHGFLFGIFALGAAR